MDIPEERTVYLAHEMAECQSNMLWQLYKYGHVKPDVIEQLEDLIARTKEYVEIIKDQTP